jgi:O-methyltransferase
MLPSIVTPAQLDAMVKLALMAPPGDFAEVGVYQGGSAQRLYGAALSQGRRLHLFDTFTGTPYYTEGLDHHKINDEFCAPCGTIENIREMMPFARLYVGRYPETHPHDLGPLAFVHVDCDQYLSYRAVIGKMWPLLVPGGIMLFDDYPYLEGAKRAVEEKFDPRDLRVCHSRNYMVKPPA